MRAEKRETAELGRAAPTCHWRTTPSLVVARLVSAFFAMYIVCCNSVVRCNTLRCLGARRAFYVVLFAWFVYAGIQIFSSWPAILGLLPQRSVIESLWLTAQRHTSGESHARVAVLYCALHAVVLQRKRIGYSALM